MATSRSSKKRIRQNRKRRGINRAVRGSLKTQGKRVLTAIETGTPAEAEGQLRELQVKLDKAAKAGKIHRNKASRRKSRLQKKLNVAKATAKKA